MSKSICNLASNRRLSSSIGHFRVPVAQARPRPPDLPQSMVAIAAGYAAIDKKSWTQESQPFTLEEWPSESTRRIGREYPVFVLHFLEVAMSSTTSSYQYESQRPVPKENATNSASPQHPSRSRCWTPKRPPL